MVIKPHVWFPTEQRYIEYLPYLPKYRAIGECKCCFCGVNSNEFNLNYHALRYCLQPDIDQVDMFNV